MTPVPDLPGSPRALLILKTDTLGDLVLFAPTLRALQAAWPAARLMVLIRQAYAELGPMLAPGIEWLTTTIDPFAQGPAEVREETARLRAAALALQPDLVVAATSRRNWLEAALGSDAAHGGRLARRVALGAGETDPFFTVQLRLQLGIEAAAAFDEQVEIPADEPDWQRNLRLADALLGRAVERTLPSLAVAPAAREAARILLAQLGLTPGGYLVCAAAGFANVAIKTWPAEKFGATLRHARERHRLPALLVGHEGERAHLENVRELAGGTALWLGRDGELGLLIALIAESAIFVGNDTGALHLAAALDVAVVGVYGGGTWPRFVPAARRGIAVVHPLPCFGCGWDCAFGDAPCVKVITVENVTAALDRALAQRDQAFGEISAVENLPAATCALMGAAAANFRALQADHLARQLKIEEKDREISALKAVCDEREREGAEKEREIAEKDREIIALKAVCDDREKMVVTVHGHAHALTDQLSKLNSEYAILQSALASLPANEAEQARALHATTVHIRNLDALNQLRAIELAELRATAANLSAGRHDLEQAKHYGRLLAEKEAVIQSLRRGFAERESLIKQLLAETTTPTAKLHKLRLAARVYFREKWWRPFDGWLFRKMVEEYWMQIGVLRHYEPRPLQWDRRLPGPRLPEAALPQIGLVTPSYGQEKFIERTLLSVLGQRYPKLRYVVQDGGSKDRSAEIIARHAAGLHHWESAPDRGQADAVQRGFAKLEGALAPGDIMAWLNSDDLLAPGTLRFVAEYFTTHPEVDVLYGHRIIIDDDDRDVGRWIMPRHKPEALEWIDYVPQETLFWRKRAWDRAGGIDPSFQFALDWDLLARLQQSSARMVRVPYFLGAFRVHADQKTSQAIHTTGAEEMRRIRTRFHGEKQDDAESINRHARETRFWGAVTARLHGLGIRW